MLEIISCNLSKIYFGGNDIRDLSQKVYYRAGKSTEEVNQGPDQKAGLFWSGSIQTGSSGEQPEAIP